MNIGILGAGSIGLHLAAQLSMAGKEIVLLCRTAEQAESFRANGFSYRHLDGTVSKVRVKAVHIEDSFPPLQWILLTVKQTQLVDVIPHLKRNTSPLTKIICFQNGIGHEKLLGEHLGMSDKLLFAVTTEGAYRSSMHSIHHTGRGKTWIGPWEKSMSFESHRKELAGLFAGAQLEVSIESEMKPRVWKKLVINSCINPLTAILEVRNGYLLESAAALALMKSLFDECRQVAKMEGVEIPVTFMKEITNVCRNTYHNKSSMLQDIEEGKPTEIEYINGAVRQLAEKHSIPAPSHAMAVSLILAKQELPVGPET